jgi:hypothetical protein
MNVCTNVYNEKNKQKKWQRATKPLKAICRPIAWVEFTAPFQNPVGGKKMGGDLYQLGWQGGPRRFLTLVRREQKRVGLLLHYYIPSTVPVD